MDIFQQILQTEQYNDCIVEYYPHIIMHTDKCGSIITTEDFSKLKIPIERDDDKNIVEYICGDKKMIIIIDNLYEEEKCKEYMNVQQKGYFIDNSGVFVIANIKNIDPNRFSNVDKYFDVVRKHEITYRNKCISLTLVTEKNEENELNYIKIWFNISDTNKKSLSKHFKEVISWLK